MLLATCLEQLTQHPVIAEPADQAGHRRSRGSRGGRPPEFDAHRYKDRNVVERSYHAIKQLRALATRYDKLAITYRAGLLIRAVVMWLHALGDAPYRPKCSVMPPTPSVSNILRRP